MESNWATEHLQVIRTLMERSAVYRRALAPIMIFSGVIGIAWSLAAWLFQITSAIGFVRFWSFAAAAALIGSLLLVRRQALKDREPFWSPPTRRIAQAMFLPLAVGFVIGVCVFVVYARPSVSDSPTGSMEIEGLYWLPAVWAILHGCAMHSAGFFAPRGLRLFGWAQALAGCAVLAWIACKDSVELAWWISHLLMGLFFGVLHLAYGAYLYLTEKGKNVA